MRDDTELLAEAREWLAAAVSKIEDAEKDTNWECDGWSTPEADRFTSRAKRFLEGDGYGKPPLTSSIISEVYKAVEHLGGQSDILSTIGSWGDTLDDSEIYSMLRQWNAEAARRSDQSPQPWKGK